MKKNILLSVLFSIFISSHLSAQTMDYSKLPKSAKEDTVAKKILEPAQYVVTYQYRYAKDAAFPENKKEGATVLQIGDRYNRFADYYGLAFDSLVDVMAKEQRAPLEIAPKMMAALKRTMFTESIIFDKQKNMETIQRTAGLSQKYQYEETTPALKWDLQEGDTVIAGYHCNKATTHWAGRDYVAWYSPEVNLPYGPFKFNGLPGLVFQVVDTQDNFEFTLAGLEKVTQYTPIYQWAKKDIVKTSRDKVRKIYKNYCADPAGALTADGSVTISAETRAKVKAKPYNPMELE